jgi:hypothetical protein
VLRQLTRWCREHDTTVAELRRGGRGPTRATPNADDSADADHHDATTNPGEKADTRG